MAVVTRTVLGPINPAALGVVLTHEHLWMDSSPLLAVQGYRPAAPGPWDSAAAAEARWNPGSHPDNYRLTDVDATVSELAPYRAAGGGTVVDLTPPSLGRDVRRLAEIAGRANVHVVAGAGQYLGATHDPWVGASSEAQIAARLVAEATDGIDGTSIRAGIYGEIGTSNPVRPDERRVLRAVAAASRETGLSVSVHLHPWGYEGATVLDELLAAGAHPDRVVLGHVSTAIDRPDGLRALLERGASLGFDLFGFDHSLLGPGRWPPADRAVAELVAALVAEGHAAQLFLSQDIGVRTRLRRWGGWGYAHLLEHVVPILRELGVGQEAIDTMLVANAARLLAVPA